MKSSKQENKRGGSFHNELDHITKNHRAAPHGIRSGNPKQVCSCWFFIYDTQLYNIYIRRHFFLVYFLAFVWACFFLSFSSFAIFAELGPHFVHVEVF